MQSVDAPVLVVVGMKKVANELHDPLVSKVTLALLSDAVIGNFKLTADGAFTSPESVISPSGGLELSLLIS